MEEDWPEIPLEVAERDLGAVIERVNRDRKAVMIVHGEEALARIEPAPEKFKTVADLEKAWKNRTRLQPGDAALWEAENDELRASLPLPRSIWD